MRLLTVLRAIILWLFFFNGLLDRLATHYFGYEVFTTLFYACVSLAVALQLVTFLFKGLRGSVPVVSAIIFLLFVFILGALYGDPLASLYGIKLFFFGSILLVIFGDAAPTARQLLVAVLFVQAYALFQGAYFFLSGLQLPPWDAEYVARWMEEALGSQGGLNLYVGDLIRPFATFSSFFEYQVSTHAIAVGLFLARKSLDQTTRRLGLLVLLSTLGVDVLFLERTPVMLAAIAAVTAAFGSHIFLAAYKRQARLLLGLGLVAMVCMSFIVIPPLWQDSTNPMLKRTAETFRFWEAETVRERVSEPWRLAIQTLRTNPEGVGPAEVATGYNPNAQTPHNNILLFAIGYSVLFPLVFFVYLVCAFSPLFQRVLSLDEERSRIAFTAVGLVLGYLAAGQFNSPFSSYPGGALFLTLATLRSCALGEGRRREGPSLALVADAP